MAAENAYKYDYAYSSAVPAKPLDEERKQQKKPMEKPLQKMQTKAEYNEKQDNRVVFKFAAGLVVLMLMFGIVCNSYSSKYDAQLYYENMQASLNVCQAENQELNAKLAALRSVENIDRYAVEVLGLVKVTPENEIYLDSSKGNEVVLSQSGN